MVIGLQAVDAQSLELLRVLSATRREVFFKLRVYASLPYLFAALKIAAPTAVIGAIVSEWISAEKGLGFLIIQTTHNFQTPLLYATMITTSAFALFLLGVISLAERFVVRWHVDATTA
jgi:NitT/TauT family transport system permease protein